jgi:hypothetical protein
MIEYAPYRALWSAVLFQAIRDLDSCRRREAVNWVFSDRTQPCSMRWICDVCDLDYEKLQNMCLSRAGRARLLGRDKRNRKAKGSEIWEEFND